VRTKLQQNNESLESEQKIMSEQIIENTITDKFNEILEKHNKVIKYINFI
jgi:hypothetical protein